MSNGALPVEVMCRMPWPPAASVVWLTAGALLCGTVCSILLGSIPPVVAAVLCRWLPVFRHVALPRRPELPHGCRFGGQQRGVCECARSHACCWHRVHVSTLASSHAAYLADVDPRRKRCALYAWFAPLPRLTPYRLTVSCALGQATFSMTFVTRGFFRATIGKAKPTSEPDCVLTTRVTGPGEILFNVVGKLSPRTARCCLTPRVCLLVLVCRPRIHWDCQAGGVRC